MGGRRNKPHDDETEVIILKAGAAPVATRLRVIGASTMPSELALAEDSVVIGTSGAADLVVTHPNVSRRHLKLTVSADGITAEDLGSSNGTYYLGQRIERVVLAVGSRLQLADDVELLLEPLSGAYRAPSTFEGTSYRGLVGVSSSMRELFTRLEKLERSDVTVLITGESGVGKELVARALHDGSERRNHPYVALNCGALAPEAIASELFGHKKGAFTGATDARPGAFVSANGGTLFLDEIGELPLTLQPMLLRALESGEVRALGADRSSLVDVRVIAATNRDLKDEIEAGRFRQDIYFRLAIVQLAVAPLRERIDDVPILAEHFARTEGIDLPPAVLEALKARSYPGNVRELRNTVQAFAALGELPADPRTDNAALRRALRGLIDPRLPFAEQKDRIVDEFSRLYLTAALEQTGGNQAEAARLAGLDRTYLGRLLTRLGLK